MPSKSRTCMGKQTGQPLTEYATELEAALAADHIERAYGRKMVPYRCQRCSQWHHASANRHTPSRPCHRCVGRNGQPKESYRNEHEAKQRAEILRSEQRVNLRVYSCPHGDGWHLTRG